MSNNNFNQTQIRDAFGHFATGVCIMTAKTNGHDALGVTVNSFSSLSLDPPLLLWSLKSDAECFDAFYNADTFTVNVLNSEQKDICSRHANQKTHYLHPGSYSIGDIEHPTKYEGMVPQDVKVQALTTLTLQNPQSIGYLTLQRKLYLERIKEEFDKILKRK